MKRALVLLSLLIALGAAAPAALREQDDAVPERLVFEHISLNEGLSQVSVEAILQDRQGFLWIGTQDGLNRYDGYAFTVYKHNPGSAGSLSSNIITALYEDAGGTLWIGTAEGLNRFDRRTQTFAAFHRPGAAGAGDRGEEMVTAIAEGPGGTLWIGGLGDGLYRFDPPAGAFSRPVYHAEQPPPLNEATVTALHTDADGRLWVGTRKKGLYRFDPWTGRLERYSRDTGDSEAIPGSTILALAEATGGKALWVGTDEGVCRLDYRSDLCAPVEGVAGYARSLAAADDVLWIGTVRRGLFRFDLPTEQLAHYPHEASDPASVSSDHITALHEDHSGVLWVGTADRGLSRSDRDGQTFAHYQHRPDDPASLSSDFVWAIHEDRAGTLWIGTAEGLSRLDAGAEAFVRYRAADHPDSLRSNAVHAVLEDDAGRLWVGTMGGGLHRFNPETEAFTAYRHDPKDSTTLGGDFVRNLAEDPDGSLWVGTYQRGLSRLDPETGRFTHYRHSPKDSTTLGSDNVSVLYVDRAGTLWAGTSGAGLSRFNRETGTFTRYRHDPGDPRSLSNNIVLAVREDMGGALWVGTYGGGLNRFDPPVETFTRYTEHNSGLPSNTVIGILEGPEGALWLSTQGAGLVKFDPAEETFRSYDVDRGVQSKEFNMGAYHKGQSGTLYFGGVNGFNAFDPQKVEDNTTPPQVVLTDFTIRSQEAAEPDSSRRLLGDAPDSVALPYDFNDLSFDYVGLHYAAPERNQYAYLLENYDKDWRQAGTQRTAIYTNLDPGDYVFRVRAANRDGVWSEEGAALAFTIRPPWWRTWWAYGAYGLVLAAGVFVVDRVQRRRLIQREREKALIREAELKARAAEAENARKTRELEEARQLQLSMLPKAVPDHPHLAIAAYMHTATEVGGDYYDFATGPGGALTVVIGDATGHGVRAGTMVTATKSLFNSLAGEADLVQILERATRAIRGLGLRRLYMAVALARFESGRLELVGAGLPPALIHRAATGRVDEVPLKGAPLGSVPGFRYRKTAAALAPGDTMLLMTDGFAETFNPEGRMLGYDRARAVLKDAAPGTPEEITQRFAEESERWADGRPPNDDLTFVVLQMKRSGHQPPSAP